MEPVRVELTVALIRACAFTDRDDVLVLLRASFTAGDAVDTHHGDGVHVLF